LITIDSSAVVDGVQECIAAVSENEIRSAPCDSDLAAVSFLPFLHSLRASTDPFIWVHSGLCVAGLATLRYTATENVARFNRRNSKLAPSSILKD